MGRQAVLLAVAAVASACAADSPPAARRGFDILLPREIERIESVVPRRATLESLLRGHDIPLPLVQAAVASARAVFNPRQLRADRPYRLVRSLDGWLREFEYEIDADRFLRIVSADRRRPDVLEATVLPIEKEVRIAALQGSIDAAHPALVAAVDAAGADVQLAIALAQIFAGELDFESDLQPGDSFEVLVEKFLRDGQAAGFGAILAARFTTGAGEHRAFRWVDPSTSKVGYYDDNGRSLKRPLLKSPLRFEPRVTSGFSYRRLHPVHRDVRPHLGLDYAAPAGAAVVAVADGVVVSAGRAGAGGNQIRLRHAGGLESYYLHLSSFVRGIRAGARVRQGQLIGRVGATGTATAPHLDYRIRRNGTFVDPRREHARQPPGDPIPSVLLPRYHAAREAAARQLSTGLLAEGVPAKGDVVRARQ